MTEKNKQINILGVKIDKISLKEALRAADSLSLSGSNSQYFMVTCNPEIILHAQKDETYKNILNSASLLVADGFGLILASKFLNISLSERVVGVDFLEKFCGICASGGKSIFLLGGDKDIARKTAENLKNKYSNLKIAGWLDGDIDLDNCHEIIKNFNPDILFVAFGHPKQEKWIYDNLAKIPSVKFAMGIGGAFDFISGRVWRAPKFMRKVGLEWFWRLLTQPWRVKRIFNAIIIFPVVFLVSLANKKN